MDSFLKVAPFGIVTIVSLLTQLQDIIGRMNGDYRLKENKDTMKNISLIGIACVGLMQLARSDYRALGSVTFITALLQYMNKFDTSEISRFPMVIGCGILTFMF